MGKGGGSSQLTGYRYYFDLLMGLCRGPVDRIVGIRVGDLLAWPTNASAPGGEGYKEKEDADTAEGAAPIGGYYNTAEFMEDSGTFLISRPNLFGGDKGEGGVLGNCTVMMGRGDQIVPEGVKASISHGTAGHRYNYTSTGLVGIDAGVDAESSVVVPYENIPDFRGMATLFYSGTIISNNPYPKTWKIRSQRALKGWDRDQCWYPEKAVIQLEGSTIRSMNPAHILYQCFTDRTWGRGLDPSELSDTSFRYAANLFYAEGFGLNLHWDVSEDLSDFIQKVVDHVSAVILISRRTGLIEVRAIRDDYDPASVPVFGYDSGLVSITTLQNSSGSVSPNEVVVKWHDPVEDQDRQVRVQNLAAIQGSGAKITTNKDYAGIGEPTLAKRVALRDLKMYSSTLKRFKIVLDRRAWKMQPGHVLALHAPDRSIDSMIVRVMTYDDGTLTDGKITIECAEDVFSMPLTQYAPNPGIAWINPTNALAAPPGNQLAYEATYYDMQRALTEGQRSEVGTDEGGVVVIAARPTGTTLSAEIISNAEGETPTKGGTATFAPTGVAKADIGYYDTSFYLATGTDLDQVKPGGLALLGNEMVRVNSFDVNTGRVQVSRGVVDTIPEKHDLGSVIYFYDTMKSGATKQYSVGETVEVSLLTRTSRDKLAPSEAVQSSVTITGRWAKPYPPGDVRVNHIPALTDEGIVASGTAAITWASRNKVIQADQLVASSDGSIAPEAGTTYTLQIRAHGSPVLLHEYSGITETHFNYTDALSTSNGDPVDLDIRLFTVVNGEASQDAYNFYVIHIGEGAGGYGGAYGYYYGEPPYPSALLGRTNIKGVRYREFFAKRRPGNSFHRNKRRKIAR